jgi:hypothetical protein
MLVTLVVQPHNWHFVCFWNATQTRQQKLTLHKLISTYKRKISTSLYIFTSKRKLREKVEWRQARAVQKLEEIMLLYICFCFWILWGHQTHGPPNFARCWHHKKDMMVWYKLWWYVQNECVPRSWHKMTNENIIIKKVYLFFVWYNLSHMQIELVNEWIKNDRWKDAHNSTIDEKNRLINPW